METNGGKPVGVGDKVVRIGGNAPESMLFLKKGLKNDKLMKE